MPTARTRAAMNKPAAEPKAEETTTVTNPLRALLIDLAEVFSKHANGMPLTVPAQRTEEEPPWDEGPPRANRTEPEPEPEPEPVAEEKPAPAAKRTSKKAAAKAPAPEPAEAEELTPAEYLAELEDMGIAELRALLVSLNYVAEDVESAPQTELIETALGEKFPGVTVADVHDTAAAEAGDPDLDDVAEETEAEPEPEEDEDGTAGVTREELLEMKLPALRQLAAGLEIPKADYIGLDVDSIVDLILQYQEGAEAEEEEGGYYTEADFREMSRADLFKLATNPPEDPELPGYGYNPPKNIKQEDLIQLLLHGPSDQTPGF